MKKPIIIHPFLFAIFPVLFLYTYNIGEVFFPEILLPSAIIIGLTVLLFCLTWLILRDSQKTGLVISISLFLFFTYGHIYDLARGWKIFGFNIGDHKYFILIWLFLLVLGIFLTIRTKRNLENLSRVLNVVAFFLMIIPLMNLIAYEYKTRDVVVANENSNQENKSNKITSNVSGVKRDIYYIILDGYANTNTLKELYNFDNHEFTNYLNEKSFFIASQSRSNYAITYLSIASSLNMKYLNYLTEEVSEYSKNREVTYQLTRDSEILNFLKSKGYKTIHFNSGWRETNDNPYADLNIKTGRGNEFVVLLIQTTMLDYFEDNLIKHNARKRILGTFEKLTQVLEIKGPKFVFAHILVPHPPYLFDRNGEPVPKAKLKMSGKVWEHRENYINQLIFVNKKIKILVDELLDNSEAPPIIVFQSDHGSASLISHYVGWDNPTDEMLKERMRIFTACYLPPNNNGIMYESITSANVFRIIFNKYFEADYKLLDDQSYFSTYERPYKFVNVTETVEFD